MLIFICTSQKYHSVYEYAYFDIHQVGTLLNILALAKKTSFTLCFHWFITCLDLNSLPDCLWCTVHVHCIMQDMSICYCCQSVASHQYWTIKSCQLWLFSASLPFEHPPTKAARIIKITARHKKLMIAFMHDCTPSWAGYFKPYLEIKIFVNYKFFELI